MDMGSIDSSASVHACAIWTFRFNEVLIKSISHTSSNGVPIKSTDSVGVSTTTVFVSSNLGELLKVITSGVGTPYYGALIYGCNAFIPWL